MSTELALVGAVFALPIGWLLLRFALCRRIRQVDAAAYEHLLSPGTLFGRRQVVDAPLFIMLLTSKGLPDDPACKRLLLLTRVYVVLCLVFVVSLFVLGLSGAL